MGFNYPTGPLPRVTYETSRLKPPRRYPTRRTARIFPLFFPAKFFNLAAIWSFKARVYLNRFRRTAGKQHLSLSLTFGGQYVAVTFSVYCLVFNKMVVLEFLEILIDTIAPAESEAGGRVPTAKARFPATRIPESPKHARLCSV